MQEILILVGGEEGGLGVGKGEDERPNEDEEDVFCS